MKTIYHIDPATGVYLGPGQADPNPLDETDFLMPAHSTDVAPPANIPDGQVAVFDPASSTWALASASLLEPAQPDAEPLTLDQLKAVSVLSIDTHFEHLYYQTVPNSAVAAEYAVAYASAKAWIDAGAAGDPPVRVQALAESYSTPDVPVSAAQAAAVVVQKWDAAQAAQDQRGAARLRAKTAIRAAADQAAVFAAEIAGKAAMEAVTFSI